VQHVKYVMLGPSAYARTRANLVGRIFLSTIDSMDFMSPKEREKFAELPYEFMVYRGFQGESRGLSWSLCRDVAERFSNLNSDLPKGEILERFVRKSQVFAVIDNDDQEICSNNGDSNQAINQVLRNG